MELYRVANIKIIEKADQNNDLTKDEIEFLFNILSKITKRSDIPGTIHEAKITYEYLKKDHINEEVMVNEGEIC